MRYQNRKSIRLKEFDYTQPGAYFVTLVTWHRLCIFGSITDGAMHLNVLGELVANEWEKTAAVRNNIQLDKYVVMPNHIHGIIFINQPTEIFNEEMMRDRAIRVGARRRLAPTSGAKGLPSGSIGAIVGQIKSITTKRINNQRNMPGDPVWQRNYFEHVIRSEIDLMHIRNYIINNPICWETDDEKPRQNGGFEAGMNQWME
jgi:putative transposase